jgi:flagella basal body P-ring formation protein FlgA
MLRPAIVWLAALLLALPAAAADAVRANRTLRVGDVVAAADLSEPADGMVGMEVRRAVYAGYPVTMSDLGPPTLVRRNEIVTMSFVVGGIELRAEGRALRDGGAGVVIEVMNLVSRRTVRATIVGTRAVEVRR